MQRATKEWIMLLFFASLITVFYIAAYQLNSRFQVRLNQLTSSLEREGLLDAKFITKLDIENLSKRWSLYSRSLTFDEVDLRTIVLSDQGRSRRTLEVSKKVNFLEFLAIVSLGLLNDSKVIFPALLLSIAFALSLPLFFIKEVRISSFVPFAISYVPPFLVIVMIFYFKSSSTFLTILSFGLLASTRLGIQIANAVRSLEKDDYVIYMILGGHSRRAVTLKYTYFELLDSVLWTTLWTFYTLFSLKLAMNSLSLGDHYEINLGALLMGIFSELPSKTAFQQFLVLATAVALLYMFSYVVISSAVSIFKLSVGIASGTKEKRTGAKVPNKIASRKTSKKIPTGDFLGIHLRNLRIFEGPQQLDAAIVRMPGPAEIDLGDKVFVKGPSGVGKTLLTNALIGILWDKRLAYSGQVTYKFTDDELDVIDKAEVRHELFKTGLIEIVPQNPKHGFNPYASVMAQIKDFGLFEDFCELVKTYFSDSYDKIMKSINLPPSKINDGTLQIINFVLTVAKMRDRKGVVLFDEPIASLSKQNVLRVYRMLSENLWDERHLIFWIGHELETITSLKFNKILSIEEIQQEAVASLTTLDSTFFGEYEKRVNGVVNRIHSFIEKKAAMTKGGENEVTRHIIINVDKISFKGGKIAVRPKNKVRVSAGDVVLIKGDNGTGKTTMVKAITGYLRYEVSGEIIWFDGSRSLIVNKSDPGSLAKAYWKEVDVIFQNPDLSVPKYLEINERMIRGQRKIPEEVFKELLKHYNLDDCYGKRFHQLSYGQKKRVKLVRAILKDPTILLLDEPTSSLDIKNIENFTEMLERIATEKPHTMIFIVSHQDVFEKVPSHLINIIEMEVVSEVL